MVPSDPRPVTTPKPPARPGNTQRGSSSVEFAVLFPVVLLLVVAVIQIGLMGYTKHAVDTAAREAVSTARLETATAADGKAAAWLYLSAAGNLVSDASVAVSRGETVTATVTAQPVQLIPGLAWELKAVATGPVETFIPEPERS